MKKNLITYYLHRGVQWPPQASMDLPWRIHVFRGRRRSHHHRLLDLRLIFQEVSVTEKVALEGCILITIAQNVSNYYFILIENAYLFNHVDFWQDIVFLSKSYDCVSINVLNFQNVTFNEFSFWNRIFCCRHLSSIVEAYVM